MQEEYLHYLFKNKFFENTFDTIKGETIEVLSRGHYHHNAGPDFLEAKIKYDNKVWAGHIEFHVKSSDWYKHKHQNDENYNNVIAHFVYEYDAPVFIDNFEIPTVVLKPLIKEGHFKHYLSFKNSKDWIPCEKQIESVDEFIKYEQKEKALFNRMQRKSAVILKDITRFQGNQQKGFWLGLAKVFGGKVNSETFCELVERIEAHHLANLNYNQTDVEAYCFGLAGFLKHDLVGDDYLDELKDKFYYQTKLFNLSPMNVKSWKFSRMRPGNFPTIRLAQFAALISETHYDFREMKNVNDLKVELCSYWKQHYHFGKTSSKLNIGLSVGFKSLISINAVLPFQFALGIITDEPKLKVSAIESLSLIKGEENSIIKKWKTLGISVKSAFDSQALIEQKNEFCKHSKCLQCKIGQAILKPKI